MSKIILYSFEDLPEKCWCGCGKEELDLKTLDDMISMKII